MVNRNIQMKKRNNDTWENLFPLTLFENVYDNEGVSLPNHFSNLNETIDLMDTNFTNDLANQKNDLESEINTQTTQLQNYVDDGLSSLETSVNNEFTELKPRINSLEKYEQEQTIENGIWSWWQYPLSQFKDNKTFYGIVDSSGVMSINSFNHSNDEINTFPVLDGEEDDHNAPTISFLQDGRPIVFYTRHNQDKYVRYRIGSQPYNIQSLGSEKKIGFSGRISYAQSYVDENNKVHVFTRIEATKWAYIQSSDGGENFDLVKTLIDFGSEQSYLKIKPHRVGGQIRIMFTGHPQSDVQDIYYCFLEANTGKLTIPGNQEIANLYNDSSTVLTVDDLYTAYSPPVNQKTRLFDVSDGELSFLFAEFTDNNDGLYKYGKWNGTSFDIFTLASTGQTIGAGNSGYFGGGIIPENTANEYVISREDSGTWTVERHLIHQGVSEVETIDSSTTDKLFRPIVPVGNQENLLWVKGQYSEDNFTDFDTDIIFQNNILSSINHSMREIKQDRILPDNLKIETLKVSLERIPNPDVSFPLKFSYEETPNIIFNARSGALNDIRDSYKVVAGINSSKELRLVGESSNVDWNGSEDLHLNITIIGT